jgi:hypothetical protein
MAVTVVETVLLSVHAGRLAFRVLRRRLPRGTHPDELARRLAGFGPDDGGLLHSTSWRFDGGVVVLTYAALPDPTPAGATPVDLARPTPYPVDPLAPGRVHLTVHDIAVHACRHLAFLRRTDPLVASGAVGGADQHGADGQPELWDAIDPYEPALAGALPAGRAPGGTTVLT